MLRKIAVVTAAVALICWGLSSTDAMARGGFGGFHGGGGFGGFRGGGFSGVRAGGSVAGWRLARGGLE